MEREKDGQWVGEKEKNKISREKSGVAGRKGEK